MPTDILTAEQYRNQCRLERYADRLSKHYEPIEHARRARKGMRVIARLHRLFRAAKRAAEKRLPITY